MSKEFDKINALNSRIIVTETDIGLTKTDV